MSEFNDLVDEFLEFNWKSSPSKATYDGIHKYDDELDRVDRDFLNENNKKRKEYLKKLEKIEKRKLTDEEHIDWLLLKNHLEVEIKTFEQIRYWEKHPAIYADIGVDSLFILFIREFAPIEERAAAILSRMKKIPKMLEDGQRNLKSSPEIFTKLAIKTIEGAKVFLKTTIPKLSALVPKLNGELSKASNRCLAAFDNYNKFLKNEYLSESKGDFAIGLDLFNFKLDKNHMLPYRAAEILEIGKTIKKSTEAELAMVARTIDAKSTWLDVVNNVKEYHPDASDLLATYQKEMAAAREFVREKELVTIPPGEELEVIPTPEYNRPILPYAAYMPPAPFEKKQKGYFYVTPIEDNFSTGKKEEVLRGHPFYGIPVTALHEGYPGHHLQLVRNNQLSSKIRRLLHTNVFIEGWALYCEEMMYDAGFYSDPRSRLMQLKHQLLRACRVIIDVGLHTKKMDYEQAVDLLVNCAKLQRVHAEKEVTRYTFTPTQPMSYLIGKMQIIELKKDYQNKVGAKFNLKEFHDKLIGFGSIPICLIRKKLDL